MSTDIQTTITAETVSTSSIDDKTKQKDSPHNHKNSINNDVVLLNTFQINKKRYRVFLNSGLIVWQKEKQHEQEDEQIKQTKQCNRKTTIKICDIIAITNHKKSINQFTIHYAKKYVGNVKTKENNWQKCSITLKHNEVHLINIWCTTLRNCINDQIWRPHNLLLFINPFGGKRKAQNIYENIAKPLFQLANIDVNVCVTQRSHQIQDILQCQTLCHYDGIVCVGGDGTFSELFNGLLIRTMADRNINIKTPKFIPKPIIPIGVIPAGSTDTIAYCLHGTNDIQTAVIHICLGQKNGLDLSSVYNKQNGDLIRFYASIMSYGYLGDVAVDSENYRWMGPKRYDYSGFKKFLLNRGYEAEILLQLNNENDSSNIPSTSSSSSAAVEVPSILTIHQSNPLIGPACYENCQRCDYRNKQLSFDDGINDDHQLDEKSKIIRGNFFMINGANISCACKRCPNGFSKYCHIGDGTIDLVLVHRTSFFNNVKLLLTLSSHKKNVFDLSFVEIYRVQNFNVRAIVPTSIKNQSLYQHSLWNCDGEIIQETDVFVKSHCQLIQVYRRGIQQKQEHEHHGKCSINSNEINDNGRLNNKASIMNQCGFCNVQ